jgi:hypothetical protein
MDLNAVDFAVGLLALSGVTLIGFVRSSRRFARRNLFLRFAPNEPLELVLSVVMREKATTPVTYTRDMTSVNHLHSAAKFAQAVGGIKRRDEVHTHVCGDIPTTLAHDLVVIGGPTKNEIAALFMHALNAAYPNLDLEFRDAGQAGVVIRANGADYRFTEHTVIGLQHGLRSDYGLVVAWVNPFAVRRRRAFLCAGLSSYGTVAATTYFLDVFMHERYRRLLKARAKWPRGLRARIRLLRWPCFALLVKVTYGEGEFRAFEECVFIPLRPPKRSELPLPSPDGPVEDVPYRPARPLAGSAGREEERARLRTVN